MGATTSGFLRGARCSIAVPGRCHLGIGPALEENLNLQHNCYIDVNALPPIFTSVYKYRVLIVFWESDRAVKFGLRLHVYFVLCTIESTANAE